MKTGIKQPPAHRAGLQPDLGSAVGRGADPADRKGKAVSPRPPRNGAGTPPRRFFMASSFLIWLCLAHVAFAQLDVFHMRDGSTLTGNIVGETADAYRTLIQTPTAPMMTNVPVRAVRYVVYGTPQKARANLDLDRVARSLNARDTATVRFLPTEAFGDSVNEAVAAARGRIWILAFYISGGMDPTIDAFYNTLRAKARAGLDVRIISEFGAGTPMPIRHGTANFTHTLQADGIQVSFIQEYRVMHKKVLIVDGNVLFLGSSNLTGAGVKTSDEFNVRIESEPLVRRAEADFLRMARQAKTFEELK